ncbi:MAG TPA: rhodanese-like domain-containing protein [Terriglobales bacterium]|nr:rhodanese-like domain-containing protein [Terriglobales bacterium]
MKLHRFEVPGLAHYSYSIESQKQAVIIDPKRDVDTYLRYAAENTLRISHVLETHIHADFASGAPALAKASGAELWVSAHDRGEQFEYEFEHVAFKDGQELRIGDVRLVAIHTPGHTPEHLSFLLHDESRGKAPSSLLSGDFVFVGSFGRPDLLGEDSKYELASQLFDSVHHKIANLPDGVEVLPAHGAGSLCGSGMAQREQSTLGYERACNRWFAESDKRQFVDHVLTDVPPFPDYYRRMKKVNAAGPKLFEDTPGNRALSALEFRAEMERTRAVIIDLRRPEAFGGAHIPGAFNIGSGPLLSVWAAWVVPYDTPILLVGDNSTDYDEARRALLRVGFDDTVGWLHGGMAAWIAAGYELSHVLQVSVGDMHDLLMRGAHLIDVRTDGEWNDGHAPGAKHIFGGYLPKRVESIPDDRPVFTVCGGGYRSSLATSILKRSGRRQVANVSGGMRAWKERGLPLVSDDTYSRQKAA